ncbi:MAG: hypothetical protein AAGJ81_10595 [Verrucomicrobiota bacterium]
MSKSIDQIIQETAFRIKALPLGTDVGDEGFMAELKSLNKEARRPMVEAANRRDPENKNIKVLAADERRRLMKAARADADSAFFSLAKILLGERAFARVETIKKHTSHKLASSQFWQVGVWRGAGDFVVLGTDVKRPEAFLKAMKEAAENPLITTA